jgi:hypothetical protein
VQSDHRPESEWREDEVSHVRRTATIGKDADRPRNCLRGPLFTGDADGLEPTTACVKRASRCAAEA